MGWTSALGSIVGNVGSALTGGGSGGILGTVVGAYYDKKLASKQNSYNWSMWQANNEYNTPANQMMRLREAGLNPNLIYGSGASGATGISRSAPEARAGGMSSDKIFAGLQAYQALKLNQAQVEQVNANRDLLRAQEQKTRAETPRLSDGSVGAWGTVRPTDTSSPALGIRMLNKMTGHGSKFIRALKNSHGSKPNLKLTPPPREGKALWIDFRDFGK